MKKKTSLAHRMLYNNKVLLVFSLIISFVFWLLVVITLSPEDTRIIKSVPVTIDLTNSVPAQLDLQVFGTQDYYVDVEITGKRYVVGAASIDAGDIRVIAQTSYVDSAGKHNLLLRASKADEDAEFEIVSLSEEYISVFFDNYMEGEYTVSAVIDAPNGIVAEGWSSDTPVLSLPAVTVSGPATEMSKIDKVTANIKIDKPLESTETFDSTLTAVSELGSEIRNIEFNNGNAGVTVTVPIYKQMDAPTDVSYKNNPAYYLENPLKATVNPQFVNAGVPDTMLDGFKSVSIGTIDFATLKPGVNTFTFPASEVSNVRILDSGVKEFTVRIDASGVTEKKLPIGKIAASVINVPEGWSIKNSQVNIDSITVVGPESSLAQVTAESLAAEIDLNGAQLRSGTNTVAVRLSVKTQDDCWVYGSYSARLSVEAAD